MAIRTNLPVPYHQQDTDYYCGAACAQMVHNSIAGDPPLAQDSLYTDARNHTSELSSWYNPPDGLQWLMNDRRPASFGGWFALYSLDTEDAISRKLVWTIHHYKVAPIALVHGGDHWVVVRGFDISAVPVSSDDVSFIINAFDLNNPWPPVPGAPMPTTPPPPHFDSDGCGTGGNRGVANEHIAYTTWQSDYMTGNKYGTLWNGRFVAVCDPDPPATRFGKQPKPKERLSGENLIDLPNAVKLAKRGLKEFNLDKRQPWENALAKAEAGIPRLVQRLDRIDSYYYIVPFSNNRNSGSLAVAVDARFGNYRQSIALPKGSLGFDIGFSHEKILNLILQGPIELERPKGRILVRKEAVCVYPALVWQPCLESLSPFYPFHMITIGDQRLYMRMDGQIFTSLHTNIPGI